MFCLDTAGNLKPPKDHQSSVAYHAQWQVRQEWFPSVDGETGRVYTSTGTGRASVTNRNYKAGVVLQKHLERHFPQGCRTFVGPPRTRAMIYKPCRQQQTLQNMFQPGSQIQQPAWTKEAAALAAREFEVPEGTRILHLFPDLFDRDLLCHETAFQRPYTSDDGNKKKGVLTGCPLCSCNLFAKIVGFTCQKGSIRGVKHADGDTIFVNSPRYECSNPKCQNGRQSKQFVVYSTDIWHRYPESVRCRYQDILFMDVCDGKNGDTFVTEEFCWKVLADNTLFYEMERELEEAYGRKKARVIKDYKAFVETQKLASGAPCGALWPKFSEERFK